MEDARLDDSVTLSSKAAERLREIMKKEAKENWILHFGDVGGHCGGGYGYQLVLTETSHPNCMMYQSNGISIEVPIGSLKRLHSASIDVEELKAASAPTNDLLERGFHIKNPNEKGSCVCGCQKGRAFE